MSEILKTITPFEVRQELETLVIKDLLGPAGGTEEELDQREDRVRERYLVGMLAPKRAVIDPGEQDTVATTGTDDADVGASEAATPAGETFFPNSIGLSFVVLPDAKAIKIAMSWGRYTRTQSQQQTKRDGNPAPVWKRKNYEKSDFILPLKHGDFGPIAPVDLDPQVVIQGRVRQAAFGWVVTVFLVNIQEELERRKDEAWVFQPKIKVSGADEAPTPIIVQRHDSQMDLKRLDVLTREEIESMEMLYRGKPEFAVGHGVAVHVEKSQDPEKAMSVETSFIPVSEVEQQTPPDESANPDLAGLKLDMKELSEMPKADLLSSLRVLQTAYAKWIQDEKVKIANPNQRLSKHQSAANRAVKACEKASSRLEEGIALIEGSSIAEEAFRFANKAMWYQRVRSTFTKKVRKGELKVEDGPSSVDIPENRSWRLFQLAFIILNLPSLTKLDHPDRSHDTDAIADLLWFATGGGKTEAYLGLTAYTLAMRRLQGNVGGRAGDHGVAVLMRYTLRLLTLQQFQRAAALLCACEVIRKSDESKWGTTHFRLGLWVGNKATPNTLKQAAEALVAARQGGASREASTPHQLLSCPWCATPIRPSNITVYAPPSGIGRCVTYCGDSLGRCEFSEARSPREGLPVMMVDEEIYRRPPSLLIATVDKFAQMPWKGEVQTLFGIVSGYCERHGFLSPEINDTGTHPASQGQPRTTRVECAYLRPPDLIIQDELHLISGPLGSMVGLYECAVDELCSWNVDGKKVRPKVIASTATIRRASDQVRKLFLRRVEVFPPQGTGIDDSFYAIHRPSGPQYPGRRYLGVCAIGRRYPVTMIRVYTAFLGASQYLYEKYGKVVDPWMTLVGYFNSIRELAGTRRLVEDDIRTRVRDADQRGLSKRRIRLGAVEELTSRKSSVAIPAILERLEKTFDPADTTTRPFDVVLATNMLSVGVDIDRLGLMVVAGQPKTTSEYIQATSRVGRSGGGPGLVCTIYNWARPRDLSHYETFEHYHETFYKHVEALSVTPFAVRALDRGLSGVIVALMRLKSSRLNANIKAGELTDRDPDLVPLIEMLVQRAESATGDGLDGEKLKDLAMLRRDEWLRRVRAQIDHRLGYEGGAEGIVGLLEQAIAGRWDIYTCLNSLRDVEATVDLLLDNRSAGLLRRAE